MLRLVILDNDEHALRGIQNADSLMKYGFKLAGSFTNPLTALDQLQAVAPDLLITDMKLTGMDGLEFAEEAKRRMPDTEIVLLSGVSDFSFARAVQTGVSDYLLKPLKRDDFYSMLRTMNEKILKKHSQEYSNLISDKNKSALSKPIYASLDYISSHFSDNISLQDVADNIKISKNYFCEIFKKETGITFIQYLTNLRIEKAKWYLENSNLKMNEISDAVGYSNYSYFSYIFKKNTGITLSDYRKCL